MNVLCCLHASGEDEEEGSPPNDIHSWQRETKWKRSEKESSSNAHEKSKIYFG